MVVVHIVVILVCSLEEVSSVSLYSDVLATLPNLAMTFKIASSYSMKTALFFLCA